MRRFTCPVRASAAGLWTHLLLDGNAECHFLHDAHCAQLVRCRFKRTPLARHPPQHRLGRAARALAFSQTTPPGSRTGAAACAAASPRPAPQQVLDRKLVCIHAQGIVAAGDCPAAATGHVCQDGHCAAAVALLALLHQQTICHHTTPNEYSCDCRRASLQRSMRHGRRWRTPTPRPSA